MIVLALETSATVGSIALGRAGAELDVLRLPPESGHARVLAPGIRDLLRRHGLTARELDLVVVGTGPGGYTGVRLAVATARTFASTLGVPLLGVPSTAALAARPEVPAGMVLTVLDARKGDVYAALYEKGPGGEPREVRPPLVAPAERVVAELGVTAFVAGDGLPVLAAAAGAPLRGAAELVPRAEELLALGAARHRRGDRDDPAFVLPLYLRPSEAEIRWERHRRERTTSAAGATDAERVPPSTPRREG